MQTAISEVANDHGAPAGVLKSQCAAPPAVRIDWQFDNQQQVDLVAEDFDAAIGGGFELAPGVVARTLAPAHIITLASSIRQLHIMPAKTRVFVDCVAEAFQANKLAEQFAGSLGGKRPVLTLPLH